MESRIARLRTELATRGLDGVLVTHLPHARYLCGFSGSAGLLFLSQESAAFVTDFRYQSQIAQELPSDVISLIDRNPADRLKSEGLITEGMKLGFQDQTMSVATHEGIRRKLRKVKLVPVGDMVGSFTTVKTEAEIALIRKAGSIAGKVYQEILELVRPGMRELDVAAEISYRGRLHGAEGDAFDIIVASGPRGALPHGRASAKKIRKGELVTLDFGFTYRGFNSDMTRTFAVGEPGEEARRVYEIVLRAEKKGIAAARAGMSGKELDDVCRDEIASAGFGDNFGHATGHGLGIEVHEQPMVSARGADQVLAENMVVTVEPGIYLDNKLGVRIEDDIVIGDARSRSLTTAPRELVVV